MSALFTKDEVKDRIRQMRAAGTKLEPGYNLACFIADCAMVAQKDKAGRDYAFHTSIVSLSHTSSETKMIIGKLHDLVEDTDWTLDDLRAVGFSERVVNGVDGMTCRRGELYFDFITRCSRNPDSLDVKIADLTHNLSQARNNYQLQDKDMERLNKYLLSLNYLIAVKKAEILPGSSFTLWMGRQPPENRNYPLLRKYSAPAPGGPAPSP